DGASRCRGFRQYRVRFPTLNPGEAGGFASAGRTILVSHRREMIVESSSLVEWRHCRCALTVFEEPSRFSEDLRSHGLLALAMKARSMRFEGFLSLAPFQVCGASTYEPPLAPCGTGSGGSRFSGVVGRCRAPRP